MDYLTRLEQQSIFILREAYASFKDLGMLWSIGKDSTVLLWLARKAFYGHVPFPLVHVDTGFKIPEMIAYRDRFAREWGLTMIVGSNQDAIRNKETFPDGKVNRLKCCNNLKTTALKETLTGVGSRKILNHSTGLYDDLASGSHFFNAVIAGVRGDEEGTRSKERYFSPRTTESLWEIGEQPPEFWNQFNTEVKPGTHVRIHPILDWKEIDIWEYIRRENISTVSLYYNQGDGKRYRSLGCYPCTFPVESTARNVDEIIEELKSGKFSNIAERSGRAQDSDDGGTLETLRREGYM